MNPAPSLCLRWTVRVALLLCAAPHFALAAINSISSGDAVLGNRPGNLVANGSFEDSNWAPVASPDTQWDSWVLAGTGTTLNGGVVDVPDNWTTGGGTQNYAAWGNDSSFSGSGLRSSAPIPHGSLAVYMGNQATFVTPAPSFGANGVITFSSAPTFNHILPADYTPSFFIEQTVTGLDVNASYLLDFWTSGEDVTSTPFLSPGLLELSITGEAPIYLATPYDPLDPNLGASQRYYIDFQPSASTITFRFTNHGHLLLQSAMGSEGVMDDVILNLRSAAAEVPEPGTLVSAVLLLGAFSCEIRRRNRPSL